jgi:hypothetical protein
MGKMLEGLRWTPLWVSHLGCVKGCLNYLGLQVSNGWLFGATGHAFVINVHDIVCPSGPTAWNTEMITRLGKNLGYETRGLCARHEDADFERKVKTVWENTKLAIDNGLPSYGWELKIPEFYVVYGYDDIGYYYSGVEVCEGTGPKPWQELGNTKIGLLEMYSLSKTQPADDKTTVKEALAFALAHASNRPEWTFPKYHAGLAAFDAWVNALEGGTADGFGVALNAAVWHECRQFAVDFLKEAKERLGSAGPSFDEAISCYQTVAESLKKVTELFPFPPNAEHIKEEERRKKVAKALKSAREAEAQGLKVLDVILKSLQ